MNLNKILFFILIFTISQLSFAQNPTFDSLANEINILSVYQKTKAFRLLDSLYQMAYNSRDSSLLIACCLYEESILKHRQGIVDTLLIKKIQNHLAKESRPINVHALLQLAMGANLVKEGKYSEAFPIYLKEIETFKQLNNYRFVARAFNSMGNICFAIGLIDMAKYYYSEAEQYLQPEFQEYYTNKSNLFLMLSKNNKKAAIDSMLILIKIAEKKDRVEILPSLYLNIGDFFLDSLPEKAFYYFSKMKNLNFDSPPLSAILNANFGYYFLIKNNYPEALQYYKYAQEEMEHNNDFLNLPLLYYEISSIFEQQNMLDSALFYARKHIKLNQKLRSNTIAIEIHQKYIITLVETQQKDLLLAQQKIELKHKQFAIILIISGSIILLILLSLLYVNQLRKRKTVEIRETEAKLEHEKRVKYYEHRQQKLEKEKHEELLDVKSRELASYSLLVSNKNLILKQIKELNLQALDSKENNIKTRTNIDEIIKNHFTTDNEWNNFKLHFEKVHPKFFEKLKQLCSILTEENLKMCAYIKMGMTVKQTAQLLHVEQRSVIMSRARIKEKMQLPKDEQLVDFIRKM